MIKQFKTIKNLAVFKDFQWKDCVKNNGGASASFTDINIIYGRNYSGKTSLSRIVRAMETGFISDKYVNHEFCIKFSDKEIIHNDLVSHGKKIRVFNEDFIKENLKFITNPDDGINSFVILGENNNLLETEIQTIENELGAKEQGVESGLYAQQVQIQKKFSEAEQKKNDAKKSLEKQLSDKATDRKIGIKYQVEKYGDQNYNVQKIKSDIQHVSSDKYQCLSEEVVKSNEKLILEKTLDPVSVTLLPKMEFLGFADNARELITKKISTSNKIEELVKDAVLNRWVSEGKNYHKNKLENCTFCGNQISDERWKKLEQHFDEESKKLEQSIDTLIGKIEREKQSISVLKIDVSKFYTRFHQKLNELRNNLEQSVQKYNLGLDSIISKLRERKDDILNEKEFEKPDNYIGALEKVWDEYLKIIEESNNFSNILIAEQNNARVNLRFHEIANYLITINYKGQLANIKVLEEDVENLQRNKIAIDQLVSHKEQNLATKKAELRDEEKGAKKVDEYLNNYFGHQYLSLIPIKNEYGVKFEVIRDAKKAYHLSEGECSLLAFCYFMAKLDDIETKDERPIIWIDDPISSLDSNHIFFIYSLINDKIVNSQKFDQLFISTHNLDFLKYLKRLDHKTVGESGKAKSTYQKEYFIINRVNSISEIKVMPSYLKEYVTEFNYLFHQIYKCSTIGIVDDLNYTTFYNFGNNARKFFEIYLYYKYPDKGMTEETLKLFFGGDNIPALLTDRINNEYSHLCGVFERGSTPVEVPEMQLAAKRIIERLRCDAEQFQGLLISVGEQETIL